MSSRIESDITAISVAPLDSMVNPGSIWRIWRRASSPSISLPKTSVTFSRSDVSDSTLTPCSRKLLRILSAIPSICSAKTVSNPISKRICEPPCRSSPRLTDFEGTHAGKFPSIQSRPSFPTRLGMTLATPNRMTTAIRMIFQAGVCNMA